MLLAKYGFTTKAYRLLELRHVDHNGLCEYCYKSAEDG